MMNVLILDNYDSFTYNLFHYIKGFTPNVVVKRNNEITVEDCDRYSHLVFSPGPGLPNNAGILMDCIATYKTSKPMLGVCLGLQAIAENFGAKLYNQQIVKHGLKENIEIIENKHGLFKGFNSITSVGLYHSWAIEKNSLPKTLNLTAQGKTGVIMGLQHESLPLYGVQFHPESILTEFGKEMIKNWLLENP